MTVAESWAAFMRELDTAPLSSLLVRGADYQPESRLRGVVYLHCAGDAVVYVGQTTDLPTRRRLHDYSKWSWDAEWAVPSPEWWPWDFRRIWLDAVEYGLIKRLRPRLNRKLVVDERAEAIFRHVTATGFQIPGVG